MRLFWILALGAMGVYPSFARSEVFPAAHWEHRQPEQAGLSREPLDALKALVGGRGCVVRHGYLVYTWGDPTTSSDVASACKPVLSTLLLMAVQEGRLNGVDEPVAAVEPRLNSLNAGKDASITWRHLASQTSGYGLSEPPGAAYAYNDYALALYYSALTQRVFQTNGTEVLRTRLAGPLQFEDAYTFNAFHWPEREGRLALSVRDLARIGLFYLRGGQWRGTQLLAPEFIRMAIHSPIPADTPLTSGREAAMLPGQHTIGGGKNITPVGPGYYSFNWWLNRTNRAGQRLFVEAPRDTYVAAGHGGKRMLWVIPSLDLIVSWNDARIEDHDASPGDPNTKCNQAARLMRAAVTGHPRDGAQPPGSSGPPSEIHRPQPRPPRTRLSIHRNLWRINEKITCRGSRAEGLLMNMRAVNAVFEDAQRPGFDPEANASKFIAQIPDYVAGGVRAFTLNLQGGYPGYEGAVNSAFHPDGSLRSSYLGRVRRVIQACDENGAAVILGCFYQRQDQVLQDAGAVRAGVSNVVKWITASGFANVALEVANEYGHHGYDHALLKTTEGQVELLRLAKQLAPGLLVATSGTGCGAISPAIAAAGDFILVHFNNTPVTEIPGRIEALKRFDKPIVCNEDDKTGARGAAAAQICVAHGVSWGVMLESLNQHFPFSFNGRVDDPVIYRMVRQLTRP
ncbi:MAG TPA: serine hydrolase [Verrucomicrobiota bacterium]|nr:serine hydrolase [Verrucomicrobiota bacterium]HNT14839.1 serine hydrolase [Verrucomicrobiota bacterium]